MRKYVFAVLSIIAIGISIYMYNKYCNDAVHVMDIAIQGQHFSLEIAKTQKEQQKGLQGRTELCQKCGMVFIFPEPKKHIFWMKDTLLPLDILWVNNNHIVSIITQTEPFSRELLIPDESAQYVIEIVAGTVEKMGITIGDSIEINE